MGIRSSLHEEKKTRRTGPGHSAIRMWASVPHVPYVEVFQFWVKRDRQCLHTDAMPAGFGMPTDKPRVSDERHLEVLMYAN